MYIYIYISDVKFQILGCTRELNILKFWFSRTSNFLILINNLKK